MFIGVWVVYRAAADVWLLVPGADDAGVGKVSPGSVLAAVDPSAYFSRLGERTRFLHHRNWNHRIESACGIIHVPARQRRSTSVDQQTGVAVGNMPAVVHRGFTAHSVWLATGRVPFRYGNVPAGERGQRDGMAANAVRPFG